MGETAIGCAGRPAEQRDGHRQPQPRSREKLACTPSTMLRQSTCLHPDDRDVGAGRTSFRASTEVGDVIGLCMMPEVVEETHERCREARGREWCMRMCACGARTMVSPALQQLHACELKTNSRSQKGDDVAEDSSYTAF